MAKKRMGFEGKIYYGIAGTSATTEIGNTGDINYDFDYNAGSPRKECCWRSGAIFSAACTARSWRSWWRRPTSIWWQYETWNRNDAVDGGAWHHPALPKLSTHGPTNERVGGGRMPRQPRRDPDAPTKRLR